MKELDEIISDALIASQQLVAIVPADRIRSTCIEVPPAEQDNTPLPYIVITDDAMQLDIETKDDIWESDYEVTNASVIISAKSPNDVRKLRRIVRHAIASHISELADNERPELRTFATEGIAWDWTKPCYFDTLHYTCEICTANTAEDNDDN